MRKLYSLLIAVLVTASVFAQTPEKMSYQAVIRNSTNQLVVSHAIGMQISILQGSDSGTPVYVETQTPTTNANGLATVEIGGGSVVTGTFAGIDWSTGTYYIKTETDPTGGTSYTISGVSQIFSVPYALFSKNTANQSGTNTGDETTTTIKSKLGITTLSGSNTGDQDGSETKINAGNNITVTGTGTSISPYVINTTGYYLGQAKDGGIIFEIHKGNDGLEHGLIVALTESTAKWQNTGVLVNANRSWDGAYNTNLMTDSPAKDYVTGLGAGWYLPSIDELTTLWNNRLYVNKALSAGGNTLLSTTSNYWSSTEYNAGIAMNFFFLKGEVNIDYTKDNSYSFSVRGIRAF